MDYTCQNCGENLDGGDIFEHFMVKYMNHAKALESAKGYGWSETNRIHFSKAIIVQPDRGEQYSICPSCKGKASH